MKNQDNARETGFFSSLRNKLGEHEDMDESNIPDLSRTKLVLVFVLRCKALYCGEFLQPRQRCHKICISYPIREMTYFAFMWTTREVDMKHNNFFF